MSGTVQVQPAKVILPDPGSSSGWLAAALSQVTLREPPVPCEGDKHHPNMGAMFTEGTMEVMIHIPCTCAAGTWMHRVTWRDFTQAYWAATTFTRP